MMPVAMIVSMCAFTPNVKPPTSFKYYGDIKPLNYFDPLNFLTPTKSNEKISELTDWKRSYLLEEGLKETIEWFTNSENLSKYKANIYNI